MALDFLPDSVALCPACRGRRFSTTVCAIKWQGLAIDEVLHKTFLEAAQILGLPSLVRESLGMASSLGLGHLALDRRCDSLSGGESQRLGIAQKLCQEHTEDNKGIFLFDEPTRGLHLSDQAMLLKLFRRLTDRGFAVVCTEHSQPMIAAADRVIELGPGAGAHGGQIVFDGLPEDLVEANTATGRALRPRS